MFPTFRGNGGRSLLVMSAVMGSVLNEPVVVVEEALVEVADKIRQRW